jgi:phage replication O-like protein O
MADVQIDDGYTKVANELLEAIMRINLSSYEFRVIMAIMRKTYGYSKKQDYISLSQLEEITDIKACHICRTLKKLKDKNMILSNGHLTGIQKDYDLWKVTQTGNTQTGNTHLGNKVTYSGNEITQTGNKKLPKQVDTKEKKETYTKEIIYIVAYLNQKAGKNFKHTIRKNQELITARLNEGFTVDDFKKVIDNKVAGWKGTEQEIYLRPLTLFGTKFESYLNEKPKKEIGGKRIEKL